ncbi:hypothetical protein BF49_2549 [Bradyrhizobium sp.]|uniref:hypothetical protein n=1 Tax=Bradyrhizobium sp. TaxID=376 RepID=UPI0007C1933D|nr:hypothetical protein [Bradyrhizobium sp.]CUT11469.1 hypothetical protein BF49_2549 [Bradyrhizobium sp.]
MTNGGSHTNFDPTAFTVGAVGGALSIAGALAAGVENYTKAQRRSWSDWTVEQLRAALDCSEALRFRAHLDLNDARATNADLERRIADLTFVFKRQDARRARASR